MRILGSSMILDDDLVGEGEMTQLYLSDCFFTLWMAKVDSSCQNHRPRSSLMNWGMFNLRLGSLVVTVMESLTISAGMLVARSHGDSGSSEFGFHGHCHLDSLDSVTSWVIFDRNLRILTGGAKHGSHLINNELNPNVQHGSDIWVRY